MTTQIQSEKDPKPTTASQNDAAVKTSPEIERQLTDAELAAVSGGAYQTTSWRGAERVNQGKIK